MVSMAIVAKFCEVLKMLYLKHNECAAACGAGAVGSAPVCAHACRRGHTRFREEAASCVRKQGKFILRLFGCCVMWQRDNIDSPLGSCLRRVLGGPSPPLRGQPAPGRGGCMFGRVERIPRSISGAPLLGGEAGRAGAGQPGDGKAAGRP